jgi:predicted nucleic acid-binding protein
MSAVEPCFVDTNIWLYAFITGQDPTKHVQAQQLIQRPGIVVSVQVINEVCVNLLRKANFPELELRKLIASFYAKYQVASVGEQVLIHASDLRDRYSLSYWDSLLVAAAVESSVPILYTEDIQHGLSVDGITTITNPFVANPPTVVP